MLNIVTSSPILLVSKEETHFDFGRKRSFCIEDFPGISRKVHDIILFTFFYLIPLSIIAICYFLMNKRFTKHKSATLNHEKWKPRRKMTKLVFIVVFTFACCWFPIHCVNLISDFVSPRTTLSFYIIKIVAHVLSYTCSALNPLIYAFMSNSFRKCFRNTFACKCPFKGTQTRKNCNLCQWWKSVK